MRQCYFLVQNYIESEVVANATPSSEESSYPYSNLLDKYRRTKKWRTKGYWKVVSGENTLIFRESIGVNLTATIAAGEYSSTSAFCTAIKTALQAVGTSTYTVTSDLGTKKIKISSNGAGGGGIFEIISTDPASSDFCSLIGYSTLVDKTGSLAYYADLVRINSGEFVVWDLGTAGNPKAFILSVPTNKTLNLTPTGKLYLQASGTNVWDSPEFSVEVSFTETQAVLINSDGLADQPYRFWRLFIDDKDNDDGYFEFGSAYLGAAYAPTTGAVQFPFPIEKIDRTEVYMSENGDAFALIKNVTERFQLNWDFLTPTEKEYFEAIYKKFGKARPFYVVLDARGAFSTLGDGFARWVLFGKEPDFNLTDPGIFESRMELLEVI